MKKNLNSRFLVVAGVFIALVFSTAACNTDKGKVADVGGIIITQKDLEQRGKVSEIYYPGSNKAYISLAQLSRAYLSEKVLNSLGYKVDEQVLAAESKRIDENTKAPEVLKKIKDVYGLDKQGYMKTFIRVTYDERYLYNEVFLKSRDIHKDQYLKAQNIIRESQQSPDQFKAISKKYGQEAKTLKISEKEGIKPYEENNKKKPDEMGPGGPGHENVGMEQAARLIEMVSKVKPGEMYPELVEWQEGFQILRFVNKEGDNYIVESVSIPKRDFDEWFWENAAKIPVKIYNPALKASLLKEVSWASKINMNK
jgi:hypothetical protein